MKIKEIGYANLYYKNQKDKYASYYSSESDLHKIGFTTSAKSRAQILTKLEEVIRNKQIKVYSERLYQELKTFVWTGSRAAARKGMNDDLVISLAIGVWLYDTDPSYNKQSVDLNQAMLAAFSVNINKADESVIAQQESPIEALGSAPVSGKKGETSEWAWLLK